MPEVFGQSLFLFLLGCWHQANANRSRKIESEALLNCAILARKERIS